MQGLQVSDTHDFYFSESVRHLCYLHYTIGVNTEEDQRALSRIIDMMRKQHPDLFKKEAKKLLKENVVI